MGNLADRHFLHNLSFTLSDTYSLIECIFSESELFAKSSITYFWTQKMWIIPIVFLNSLFGCHGITYPFQNVSLSWERRVDDLVGRLTLDELIEQMVHGGRGTNGPAPGIDRLGIGKYSWNTECLHGDAESGSATAFPQSIGLAASWSKSLLFQVSEAIADEVRAKHNDYVKHNLYGDHKGLSCFSPVINIMRDPRWGRNQETYGEDPFLSGTLATSYVKGLQGDHPRYVKANAGCKHFDAYGGPENIPVSKVIFDAKVTERDLRTTFYPAFRSCVQAGSFNIMCSYNSVNGVPACASKLLMTDVLRGDWGFKGYVISDQQAVEMVQTVHRYTKSREETAAVCINNGLNLELSNDKSTPVFTSIGLAVKNGKLSESTLRERVKPLYYTRMRLGEFDPPSMNPYSNIPMSQVESPAHQELAVQAAMKSFVLLKNIRYTLPLNKAPYNKIAVIGPFADNIDDIMGDYSPGTEGRYKKTPLNGLKTLANVTNFEPACTGSGCTTFHSGAVDRAVQNTDVIFVCLGTGTSHEREGYDRRGLSLPGYQQQILQRVVQKANRNIPIIVILFSAGPVDMQWAENNIRVNSIIQASFPAQATGEALRRVMINEGDGSSFGGRLPYTWYAKLTDVPSMTNYSMQGRTYRYFKGEPLYPFGYGMSITTFGYQNINTPLYVTAGNDLSGTVDLVNTGKRAGDEVVQAYILWRENTTETPQLQLVWFDRVTVPSLTKITVNFTVRAEDMAIWLDNIGWKIEPGWMDLYVGGQQPKQKKSLQSNLKYAPFIIQGSKMLGVY